MAKRKLVLRRVEDLTPRDDTSIDEPTVHLLAESIPLEGLREPLVITAGGGVIHGMHRLEAAKRAGVAEVECVIEPELRGKGAFGKRQAQVMAENVARRHDPKLQAKQLAELVKIRGNSGDPNLSSNVTKNSPGRPASRARAAVKEVAKQKGVSESTVTRAVQKHAPEVLAPRKAPKKKITTAKKPAPKQPDAPGMTATRRRVWALFERSFSASEKALGDAGKALAAVAKHDFGDGQQWQEAFRMREDIAVMRLRVAAWVPYALCPWCGGVDDAKVRSCRSCRGAGVLGKERYEKSKRSGV